MCEILIKAIDHRMPTVQEWRDSLNNRAIPEAQDFLNQNPYTESDFIYARAIKDYDSALNQLNAYSSGKIVLTSGQIQEFINTVNLIELSSPTEEVQNAFLGLIQDESDTIPSVETRWRYHKNILDVESKKTDEEKQVELEVKDRQGCYKQGYPVTVFNDGHEWGKEERLPKFWVIKLPGVKKEDIEHYCKEEMISTGDPENPEEIYRRREWLFDITLLSRQLTRQLTRDGILVLSIQDFENFIIRVSDK